MRLIICDNKNISIQKHMNDYILYTQDNQPCIGCFSCWCKDKCIYKDNNVIKSIFEKAEKIVLITQNTYGSISVPIKRIIDKCISTVQPFFTFRNGLMRHKLRKNHIHKNIEVYFYGHITKDEKITAKNMLLSLCENLGATLQNLYFHLSLKEVKV